MEKENNLRDVFWETDLEDIQKSYLPAGKKVTDLPFARPNLLVPVRGCPLLAEGMITSEMERAKDESKPACDFLGSR